MKFFSLIAGKSNDILLLSAGVFVLSAIILSGYCRYQYLLDISSLQEVSDISDIQKISKRTYFRKVRVLGYFKAAEMLMTSKRFSEAESYLVFLKGHIEEPELKSRVYCDYAMCLIFQQKHLQAVNALQEILQKKISLTEKQHLRILYLLGIEYLQCKNPLEAVKYFEQVLKFSVPADSDCVNIKQRSQIILKQLKRK